MDNYQLVEGYYIVLKDGSLWSVKGCCRCDNGIVALPRYLDNRKIKGFNEALSIVRSRYPHFLSKPSFSTYSIPIVPHDKVAKIMEPTDIIKCSATGRVAKIISLAKEFLDILKSYTERGMKFYITGSMLYCNIDEYSDLDLVVYDPNEKYVEVIYKMVSDSVLSHLDPLHIDASSIEGLDSRSYTYLLSKSINELRYKDLNITFRFVKCDSFVHKIICGEKLGEKLFEGYVSILNDSRGIYTPSIYKAVSIYIDNNEHSFLNIYSHRIRYTSLKIDMTLYCSTYIELLSDNSELMNLDRGHCTLVAW